jgi:hypothetical protein
MTTSALATRPSDPARTAPRSGINFGRLTDSQVGFLETVPWHLEGWFGDDSRLRVVYPSLGMTSRWFSREWPVIGWEFIRPAPKGNRHPAAVFG